MDYYKYISGTLINLFKRERDLSFKCNAKKRHVTNGLYICPPPSSTKGERKNTKQNVETIHKCDTKINTKSAQKKAAQKGHEKIAQMVHEKEM